MWNFKEQLWNGKEVWVIGGGKSLLKGFDIPEDLLDSLGGDYEKFMEEVSNKLEVIKVNNRDRKIIGINEACKLRDLLDMLFFMDFAFFDNNRKYLLNREFPIVTTNSYFKDNLTYSNKISHIKSDREKRLGISEYEDCICNNINSGGAVIDLAIKMGAKRIILLGYDLGNTRGHWHKEYSWANDIGVNGKSLYEWYMKGFERIAEDLRLFYPDVEVINANKDSAINCFKKQGVKELL